MASSRRDFLTIAASSAAWQQALAAAQEHSHGANQTATGPYSFTFFKPRELETVRRFAAAMIPADDRSGGAKAARVEEYIDFVVSHGSKPLQQSWRSGLEVWRKATEAPDAFLQPLSDANDRFFLQFKDAVIEGFYTSEEGITKELGYQGLGFVREFAGCTHDSHEAPPGHRPLLKART